MLIRRFPAFDIVTSWILAMMVGLMLRPPLMDGQPWMFRDTTEVLFVLFIYWLIFRRLRSAWAPPSDAGAPVA